MISTIPITVGNRKEDRSPTTEMNSPWSYEFSPGSSSAPDNTIMQGYCNIKGPNIIGWLILHATTACTIGDGHREHPQLRHPSPFHQSKALNLPSSSLIISPDSNTREEEWNITGREKAWLIWLSQHPSPKAQRVLFRKEGHSSVRTKLPTPKPPTHIKGSASGGVSCLWAGVVLRGGLRVVGCHTSQYSLL